MQTPLGMRWPNWVDVVILTIILRMSYNGSVGGFLTEILNLTGAVIITVFTVNFADRVAGWLQPQWWPHPAIAPLLGFWGLFLLLLLGVRLLIKRMVQVIRWERLHWLIQGLGLLLGGLRGLWWSGFLLIVLASSGMLWVRQAVEERSLIGPSLLPASRTILEQVADRFPGAQPHGDDLVPPVRSDTT